MREGQGFVIDVVTLCKWQSCHYYLNAVVNLRSNKIKCAVQLRKHLILVCVCGAEERNTQIYLQQSRISRFVHSLAQPNEKRRVSILFVSLLVWNERVQWEHRKKVNVFNFLSNDQAALLKLACSIDPNTPSNMLKTYFQFRLHCSHSPKQISFSWLQTLSGRGAREGG